MRRDTFRPAAGRQSRGWTFLSNHGHVFLCLARHPRMRIRDLAKQVGITERAIQRILGDLECSGYLRRVKRGRRNTYAIKSSRMMRHPLVRHRQVSALMELVNR